ncbi:hypothetical protein LF887_20480 [Chryseobacterium sp. MEBOG06]|uniref:hypothetical protein n=1 Tax=Chryseobacterium sp. MEBOG06 TaxID=2879938 RepID=UPI001F3953BF|nr:hypothetical protein [Chryseobacterium sp. MEBOG06]UKB83363.1 hypothetical protein LF887_20480 [Chryseobacterium sp. MEBOG06]
MKLLTTFLAIFLNIWVLGQKSKSVKTFAEVKNDSIISVSIKNMTEDSLFIPTQDSKFYMIKEMKSSSGIWKPIEFWRYSTCGNSYFESATIPPEKSKQTEIQFTKGKSSTEIRIKFLFKNQIYYSNSLKVKLNLSVLNQKKDLYSDSVYKKALNVSDEKLAAKLVFLEPFAMEELSAKQKQWIERITLKNKKLRENK